VTNYDDFTSTSTNAAYNEEFEYDANGNITHLERKGVSANANMDDLTYHYIPNTNKLAYVTDSVLAPTYPIPSAPDVIDIDGQNPGNYTYDAIGNLTADASEGLSIAWNL
jgi:hypothetical protein